MRPELKAEHLVPPVPELPAHALPDLVEAGHERHVHHERGQGVPAELRQHASSFWAQEQQEEERPGHLQSVAEEVQLAEDRCAVAGRWVVPQVVRSAPHDAFRGGGVLKRKQGREQRHAHRALHGGELEAEGRSNRQVLPRDEDGEDIEGAVPHVCAAADVACMPTEQCQQARDPHLHTRRRLVDQSPPYLPCDQGHQVPRRPRGVEQEVFGPVEVRAQRWQVVWRHDHTAHVVRQWT
mmetsp:Transcript_6610/g.18239  ORF Transcript_6610/g.18239 Transcript_6610/m.18239 type:complete len:238 (-) Transcript_6610:358-1071(-)